MPRFLSRVGVIGPAGTTPATVGTNTSDAASGLTFGTDTPLYRSGVNALTCNQLDQTVPPIKTYYGGAAQSGTLATNGSSLTFQVLTTFNMPFKGDFQLHGWVNVVSNVLGASLVAGAEAAAMSGGTAPTHTGQAIVGFAHAEYAWVALPVFGVWSGLAAGALMVPSMKVVNGANVSFRLNNYYCQAIAIRTT